MHKTAFVVLAALSLSACASLAPLNTLNTAAPPYSYAKVDAASEAPAEAPAVAAGYADEPAEVILTSSSPGLSRRAFGTPTRRQPDLRLVLATARDRARFHRPRRRPRRIAPIRCTLLTF